MQLRHHTAPCQPRTRSQPTWATCSSSASAVQLRVQEADHSSGHAQHDAAQLQRRQRGAALPGRGQHSRVVDGEQATPV